jgi:uncharacterized protein YecE (DUF72 family)
MSLSQTRVRVGCAGWALPTILAGQFPGEGTHLERYARRFSAVEINSSFYRPHRPETYERWAQSVPPHFRFSVKVPRAITHLRRLKGTTELMDPFIEQVSGLGHKLGTLLVQLPPSLWMDGRTTDEFFSELRKRFEGQIVCEPRHRSWFTPEAEKLLSRFDVSRVAADPAPVEGAEEPGAFGGIVYYRMHGSPQMYYSPYSRPQLDSLFGELFSSVVAGVETWCIFDNTAAGAALPNAMTMDTLARESLASLTQRRRRYG